MLLSLARVAVVAVRRVTVCWQVAVAVAQVVKSNG